MLETHLFEDRFIGGPREVQFLDAFTNTFQTLDAKDQETIAELVACVKAGKPIDSKHYRAGIDVAGDRDELLEKTGFMHLHFSAADDDLLIYAKQYPTFVIFVTIDRHDKLKKPPGKVLNWMFGGQIAKRILGIAKARQKPPQ